MQEDIIIRRKHLDRLRTWFGRALESAAWLLCLGLLAASVVVPLGAALVWLVSGSGSVLATGIGGGIAVGTVAVWLLVRRLDCAAKRLRQPEQAPVQA